MASPLLDPDEPPAFELLRPGAPSPLFLLCDHASRRMPRALGTLGLDADALASHIAWDLGIAGVARELSARLGASCALSGYSRLAIDCNRPLHAESSVPAVTCGIAVPGNAGLDAAARTARAEALFWPYHRAIEAELAARDARGQRSVIVSLHSFTPALNGQDRPWHIGLMYGRDRRLAARLFEALAREPALCVGDNEPYRVTDGSDYGIPVYAERAGRLGVLVEVRQDLLADASGIEAWATRLEAVLRAAL